MRSYFQFKDFSDLKQENLIKNRKEEKIRDERFNSYKKQNIALEERIKTFQKYRSKKQKNVKNTEILEIELTEELKEILRSKEDSALDDFVNYFKEKHNVLPATYHYQLYYNYYTKTDNLDKAEAMQIRVKNYRRLCGGIKNYERNYII